MARHQDNAVWHTVPGGKRVHRDYAHHTGICKRCRRRFRWCGGNLKTRDARCLGCDGPLTPIGALKGARQSRVEEVDAAWMAPEAPQAALRALDPQDPATWPAPMAMRRGQRRSGRRGGRRATDAQDPVDRLLADLAQVPGPAADE